MTPRRYFHEYRDVDNRTAPDVIGAQEARIASLTQNGVARQVQLLEERVIALEEQLGALWAILEKREKEQL